LSRIVDKKAVVDKGSYTIQRASAAQWWLDRVRPKACPTIFRRGTEGPRRMPSHEA